ncbi:MAG: hypothetical protein JKX93_05715 [Rhizobiaceae bacterium]|nr:hypothetical protein [Rhizobiaceae bacterium]MBL4695872.1 hypothetical protein [Rhizobiaceae bacterium]
MLWNMTTEQWILSFSFIGTFTFICGWLADRIMGYSGFGPLGNWLLLLAGCYLGMYGFNSFGQMFHWDPQLTIAVVAGVSCTLLVFSAIIKTIVSN